MQYKKEELNKKVQTWIHAWKQGPDILFYTALTMYLVYNEARLVQWTAPEASTLQNALLNLTAAVIGCYVITVLLRLRKNLWMGLLCASAAVLFVLFWPDRGHWVRIYCVSVALILLAAGKNYRRVLKCYLYVTLAVMCVTFMGQIFHFTSDVVLEDPGKIEQVGTGHSLGFAHPNVTGLFIYLICVLVWYLWLEQRRYLSVVLFWGAASVVWFVMKSRTVFALLVCMPFLDLLRRFIVRARPDTKGRRVRRGVLRGILAGMPFLAWLLSLFLAENMDALTLKTTGTFFWTFSSRFVQGGIVIKTFGVPLFFHGNRFTEPVYMVVGGQNQGAEVLDNPYLKDLVLRGLILTIAELLILVFVNIRCIRERNSRLLLLSVLFTLIGLMENYGVRVQYNFTFLYLFAATDIISAPRASLQTAEDAAKQIP